MKTRKFLSFILALVLVLTSAMPAFAETTGSESCTEAEGVSVEEAIPSEETAAPSEEAAPAEDITPAEEGVLSEEAASAADTVPSKEEEPSEEAAPAEDTAPVEEEAPAEEARPTEETTPMTETAYAGEEEPADEAKPSEEGAPAEEEIPSEETVPAEETASLEEEEPAAATVPEEEEIPADENVPAEESGEEPAGSLFEISGEKLVRYLGREKEVMVPEGIRVIGTEAFSGNKVVEIVVLPDTVEVIEARAFMDCLQLKHVILGSGSVLREIGEYAFANDKDLNAAFAEGIADVAETAFDGTAAEAAETGEAEEATEEEIEEEEDLPGEEDETETNAGLSITANPKDVTVAVGDTATFTVKASGTGLTYQWQVKTSSTASWQNTTLSGNKTNKLSFTVVSGYFGRQYRCVVKDASGTVKYSTAATLKEYVFKITTQPKSVSVPVNGTATFTVAAQGQGLTYQWQVKTSSTASWKNTTLSGNQTNKLSFAAASAYFGRQYRCVVKDAKGNVLYSTAATLNEYVFKITTQPKSVSVPVNGTATFTVAAQGQGLTYQWQVKTSSTASWQNTTLNGNQTNKLSFTAASAYFGRQYRCVVKDVKGNVLYSTAATLNEYVFKITTQPKDATVAVNGTATFTVAAKGQGLTYQWQVKTSSTASWKNTTLSGNQTNKLSFTVASAYFGRQYRCVVKDAKGNVLYSTAATLKEYVFKITTQPKDVTVALNGTATFTVAAQGTGLTYQWQVKTSSTASWQNTTLNGNQTNKLSFTAASGYFGRQYRCVVKDAKGNVLYSTAATLKEYVFKITTQPKDATVVVNGTATFTVAAQGQGLTYQWQVKTSGTASWKNTTLGGNQTNKLSFTAVSGYFGRQYRCVVKDAKGNVLYSTAATLLQKMVKPTISTATAYQDGTVKITWSQVSGATYTLYYLKGTSGTPTTVYRSGITGTSITLSGLTFKSTYRFAVTATVGGVESEKSAVVSVKVRGRIYRALLIGQENFSNDVCPRNWGDVQLMKGILTARYTPLGTRYVTPVTRKDRTSGQVLSDIDSAFAGADDDDVSLFFIASHGDSEDYPDYLEFLEGAITCSGDTYLYLDHLAAKLKSVPGKVIVILESCGSGAAIYSPSVAENSAVPNGTALPTDMIISAFSGETVIEEDGEVCCFDEDGNEIILQGRTGDFRVANKFYVLCCSRFAQDSWGNDQYNYFTKWLTDGVGKSGNMPADSNSDGILTLNELFKYISRVGDNYPFNYGATQQVQVYPTNSSFELFKR